MKGITLDYQPLKSDYTDLAVTHILFRYKTNHDNYRMDKGFANVFVKVKKKYPSFVDVVVLVMPSSRDSSCSFLALAFSALAFLALAFSALAFLALAFSAACS